jgi:hypothetical protein
MPRRSAPRSRRSRSRIEGSEIRGIARRASRASSSASLAAYDEKRLDAQSKAARALVRFTDPGSVETAAMPDWEKAEYQPGRGTVNIGNATCGIQEKIMKIDGRCHCGYVTFEAEADPETTTICNCTDCQTMSGAPLRAIIITHPGTFVLPSGQPRNIERPPIAEMSVRKVSALTVARRSIRRQSAMSRKPTSSGLDQCANEMNSFHDGRSLFARSRHGSTSSTRFPNSMACRRIDPCQLAANQCGCLIFGHIAQ